MKESDLFTLNAPESLYNRIIGYKDKPVKLVKAPLKPSADRTIHSIYVPKEIHHAIRREFMEFASINDLNYSEKLLLWDFVKEVLRRFPDV